MKLALCDDQELFRSGLRKLLETEKDFEVHIEAGSGRELIDAMEQAWQDSPTDGFADPAIDVVLLDVRMEPMDGVETCKVLLERWPSTRVLMLTTFDSDEYVFDALRAGALGYILKDSSALALFAAITAAARGQATFSAPIAGKFAASNTAIAQSSPREGRFVGVELGQQGKESSPLSPRETQILGLISQGMSNKEIGTRLFLAEGTVKNHVTRILVKLEAKDRTHAVAMALAQSWLPS